jgi:hypothetical protein
MPLTRITTRSIADDLVTSDDLAPNLVLTGTVVTAPTISLTGTSAITLPKGSTAQRGTAADGKFRFNTTLNQFEGYSNSAWGAVGGGATGGGSDQVFIENDQTVTTNYTISTNKNAVSAGTVTINSGISVTVPTGARWVVV